MLTTFQPTTYVSTLAAAYANGARYVIGTQVYAVLPVGVVGTVYTIAPNGVLSPV